MERLALRRIGAVLIMCAVLTFPAVLWGDGVPHTGRPGAATDDRISLGRSACAPMTGRDGSTRVLTAEAGLGKIATRSASEASSVEARAITPAEATGICMAPCAPAIEVATGHAASAMLGCGSGGSAFAQASPAQVPETAAAKKKNCLWRVQSEKNTLYILGSVHLLKKESYPLPEVIERSFDNVRKLVFEVDMDSAEKPSTIEMIVSKGTYGKGSTLQSSVSPETYEMAGKRTAELGMAIQHMDKFKPWLLSITVAAGKLLKLGFNPGLGVDKHFFRKAKNAGKPTVPLETIEYQISRFDEMAPKTQEAMLLQTLKDLEILEKEFNSIVECWAAGDTASMEALMLKSFEQFPEVYEKLIAERNRNWLPQIEALLGQGEPCMVVVGALHLVGKGGIIEMLREKGHSVEQL